ncbi:MAG: PAS domain-containing protein [Candidatus Thorarchaeota archaeon]
MDHEKTTDQLGGFFMTEMNPTISDRIREELRKNPKGLTITDISTRIDTNRNSTARYLDVLQITGHVEMRKVGPAKLYFLSHRVPLDAMLNLSEDGILTYDSELRIIRVNDAFCRINSIDAETLLGNKLDQHILPWLSKKEHMVLLMEAAGGKQISFDTTTIDEEEVKYLRIKLVPTIFDDGSTGATILLEDITARKLSEEKIQRQRDFLNLVMESVAHPFYVIDASDYTIKMANRAARLGSLTKESTCFALTHKSTQPCSGNIHPCPLKQVVETKKPATVEHIHHHVSGRTRHVEIHAHPILDDLGNVVQVIEYNLDVTDRKQLEADLRILLDMYQMVAENMDDGVFVLQGGRIVYTNAPFSKKLGYEIHEMTGVELWNFIMPDDWKELAGLVSEIERGIDQPRTHKFYMMNKKNEPVQIEARIIYSKYAGDSATIFNIQETNVVGTNSRKKKSLN